MSRLPKPTPAELDLLRVLWELGPATAKEVHAAVEREMAPATGVWNPSGWTPIPEPCTMSLLCVGAATLAIRRRRKQRA